LDASRSNAHSGTPSAGDLLCLRPVKTPLRRPDVAVSPGEPAIDPVFAAQTSVVTRSSDQAGQVPIDLLRSVT
jgi:hypothetical protein